MLIPPSAPRPTPECRQYALLIGLVNRGDLTRAEENRLAAHLATCAWCQAQRAADDALVTAMRRTFTARPAGRPLFTAETIMAMAELPPKIPLRTRAVPRRTWVGALVAVMVMALITVVVFQALRPLPAYKPKLTPLPTIVASPSANANEHPCTDLEPGKNITQILTNGRDIVTMGPNEAWAIVTLSYNKGGAEGGVLHYSAGRWEQVLLPYPIQQNDHLAAISTDNAGGVWVGGSAHGSWFIERYFAGQWMNEPLPASLYSPDDFSLISMISPTDGWALWDSSLMHFDGAHWTPSFNVINLRVNPNQAFPDTIMALNMVSSTEGWAVGESGEILHYDGRAWKVMREPETNLLFSVAFGAPDDGWASGNGTGFMHYQHGAWSFVPAPIKPAPPYAQVQLAMSGPNDGWAGGVNVLLHYQQGAWSAAPSPLGTRFTIFSLAMATSDSGWAIGAAGAGSGGQAVLLRYSAGAWRIDSFPPSVCLQ